MSDRKQPVSAAYFPAVSGRTASKASGLPLLLILIIVTALLVPEDASFRIGELRMTVTRVLLILISPLVFLRFFQGLGQPNNQLMMSDIWMLALTFWIMVSTLVTEGFERAAVGAGATVLEFTVAYFAVRTYSDSKEATVGLVKLLVILIAIAAPLAIFDTLTGQYIIKDAIGSLTGYAKNWRIDYRFGLLRAAGLYEHPILLGMIAAIGVLLALTQSGVSRLIFLAGSLTGLILALSSAPVLACIIGVLLLVYCRLSPNFEERWRLLGFMLFSFFLCST